MKERVKNLSPEVKKMLVWLCLFVLAVPLGYVVLRNTAKQAGSLQEGGFGDIVNPAPQSDSAMALQNQIEGLLEQMASTSSIDLENTTSTVTTSNPSAGSGQASSEF